MKFSTLGALACFALAGAAAAVAVAILVRQTVPDFLGGLPLQSAAAAVHAAGALAAALGATLLVPARTGAGRCGLFALFALFALSLPVLGLPCVLAWALLLRSRASDSAMLSDRFTIGLPPLPEAAHGEPLTEPLVQVLTRTDAAATARHLLALRHFAPDPRALVLLRGHASSPEPEVQFVADGVLSAWHERAERALRTAQAQNDHLLAAEPLLALARLSPPSEGVPTTLYDEALAHLYKAPASAAHRRLFVEANLGLGQPMGPSAGHEHAACAARCAASRHDWPALRAALAAAQPGEIDSEIIAFWTHA